MKRISFFLIITFLAAHILRAQDGISFARWQTKLVVADGNNDEWRKPLNLYDAITGLLFTVANDSTHLYLCFTANDERKVTKLMKAGWTVEIYSKEKNKKMNAGISFPGVQMISTPGKNEGVTKTESAGFRNEIALYRLNEKSIEAKGFVNTNGNIPVSASDGIGIGIGSDATQAIIYEIAIPLKELFPGNDPSLTEEMGLHITVNALQKQSKKASTSGETSDDGRMGGKDKKKMAADIAEYNDQRLLFSEIDFKQKFRLSNK